MEKMNIDFQHIENQDKNMKTWDPYFIWVQKWGRLLPLPLRHIQKRWFCHHTWGCSDICLIGTYFGPMCVQKWVILYNSKKKHFQWVNDGLKAGMFMHPIIKQTNLNGDSLDCLASG